MSTYPAAEYGFQNTRNRAVQSSICSIAKITGKTTDSLYSCTELLSAEEDFRAKRGTNFRMPGMKYFERESRVAAVVRALTFHQ